MDFSHLGGVIINYMLAIIALTVAATLGGVWMWNHVSISIGVN